MPYTVTALHLACHWRHGKLHSQPKTQQKDQQSETEHHLEGEKKSKGSDRKSSNEDISLSLNV